MEVVAVTATVDIEQLEAKVKDMYRHVAQEPDGADHFELGSPVALRVGYAADRLAELLDARGTEGDRSVPRGTL